MIEITPNTTIKDLEALINREMTAPVEHYRHELTKLRTNRANTNMIEDIKVDCYGSEMPLKSLAVLTAPDARLLVIQPWDKGTFKDIERALLESDLGVTPATDGELIRIQLPQISTARREELVKLLHKKLEECRVGIRNIRKDAQNAIRAAEKVHKLSEDVIKRFLDTLQKSTDNLIEKIETEAKQREQSINRE